MPEQISQVPITGIDMAYWAKLTKDTPPSGTTPGTVTYDTPEYLPQLVRADLAANSQTGNYWASNMIGATATQLGDMTLALQAPQIPADVQAKWYGWKYEGGVLHGAQISPIDMAFGYRINFSDNHNLYIWLLKVKPGVANITAGTKNNSIAFQDGTINCAVAMRFSDKEFFVAIDDSAPPEGVTAADIEKYFFTNPNWAMNPTVPPVG